MVFTRTLNLPTLKSLPSSAEVKSATSATTDTTTTNRATSTNPAGSFPEILLGISQHMLKHYTGLDMDAFVRIKCDMCESVITQFPWLHCAECADFDVCSRGKCTIATSDNIDWSKYPAAVSQGHTSEHKMTLITRASQIHERLGAKLCAYTDAILLLGKMCSDASLTDASSATSSTSTAAGNVDVSAILQTLAMQYLASSAASAAVITTEHVKKTDTKSATVNISDGGDGGDGGDDDRSRNSSKKKTRSKRKKSPSAVSDATTLSVEEDLSVSSSNNVESKHKNTKRVAATSGKVATRASKRVRVIIEQCREQT